MTTSYIQHIHTHTHTHTHTHLTHTCSKHMQYTIYGTYLPTCRQMPWTLGLWTFVRVTLLFNSHTQDASKNDSYCWVCHDGGDVLCCDRCPRVFHVQCSGLAKAPEGDEEWFCPVCKVTFSVESSQCSSLIK